jgi:hypothetical protein
MGVKVCQGKFDIPLHRRYFEPATEKSNETMAA